MGRLPHSLRVLLQVLKERPDCFQAICCPEPLLRSIHLFGRIDTVFLEEGNRLFRIPAEKLLKSRDSQFRAEAIEGLFSYVCKSFAIDEVFQASIFPFGNDVVSKAHEN